MVLLAQGRLGLCDDEFSSTPVSAALPAEWSPFNEWGVAALWKGPRSALRGVLTAIRDVLFPDHSGAPVGSPDDLVPGEEPAEFALREHVRAAALKAARDSGLVELHERDPDLVRYGFVGVLGLFFLGLFFAVQTGAAACSRFTTRALLRLLGEDDGPIPGPGQPAGGALPVRQAHADGARRRKP